MPQAKPFYNIIESEYVRRSWAGVGFERLIEDWKESHWRLFHQLPGDSATYLHGSRHLLHEGDAFLCIHQDPAQGPESKLILSLIFVFMGAFLSAFLDALTVTAVIITVAYGFYDVYHRYASGGHGPQEICEIYDECQDYLKEFRGFLRNLGVMIGHQ